ncbi:MAG: hypothetical protein WKF37_03030 [Bryobacteraceae bacterium]
MAQPVPSMGMVKDMPNYEAVTNKVMRPDLYLAAMKDMGVAPKVQDLSPVKLFDGTFDPKQPEKYAKSFPIHNVV